MRKAPTLKANNMSFKRKANPRTNPQQVQKISTDRPINLDEILRDIGTPPMNQFASPVFGNQGMDFID